MGLVDCPKKGHGNAYETKCEHFFENTHLLRLREAAVNAIREFERIADLHHGHTTKAGEQNIDLVRAAARSCAMQEAYAIMLGISYDTAAGLLHKETRKEISNEQV
jgi:hypothetical protein